MKMVFISSSMLLDSSTKEQFVKLEKKESSHNNKKHLRKSDVIIGSKQSMNMKLFLFICD